MIIHVCIFIIIICLNELMVNGETDGCFEQNVEYIGFGANKATLYGLNKPGGNNNYGATGSAKGCQTLCQQTDGCGWFNWEEGVDKCWLKTRKGDQTMQTPGIVTGPRICPTGHHDCDRTCTADSPRICHYKFIVEWQTVLGKACFQCPLNITDCSRPNCVSGDGVERSILTVNRTFPGPGIVVCDGDRVVVDVENRLKAATTSIHWHGQQVKGAAWSDGVPYVTQCPILPGATFRYNFTVGPAGTFWWHSHSPLQREDGLYGKFIVRKPDVHNVHKGLYDEDRSDHVIIIQDWFHRVGVEKWSAINLDDGSFNPDNILINGKGRFKNFGVSSKYGLYTPVEVFDVEPGRRYRFRIINAGVSLVPPEITVDDHKMMVIATDGIDVQPVMVDVLFIHNGERYDVVIDTNEKEAKTYKIRFGGHMGGKVAKLYAFALLRYKGAPSYEDELAKVTIYEDFVNKPGKQLNALNRGQGNKQKMSVADLRNSRLSVEVPKEANRVLYVAYSFDDIIHPYYSFGDSKNIFEQSYIDNISNILPPSPFLSQSDSIDKEKICNYETLQKDKDKHCDVNGFCECYHIIELALNEVVDIFLIDEGRKWDVSHPFHLHGHSFHVLAMERLGNDTEHMYGRNVAGNDITRQTVKDREEEGNIPRNLDNPPLKDSVVVPDAGYTLLRLKADNPGYWLFHCHISRHNEFGMSLIFKVGTDQEIPPPPKGFPTCGNFQ